MILTTKNKIGLVLAMLLGLADLPNFFIPAGTDASPGPPRPVLVLGGICGVVTIAAVIIAWRKLNYGALRAAAGARIVSALTALPAFFVDVDPGVKALAAVSIVITVISVVLMLSPARRTASVSD